MNWAADPEPPQRIHLTEGTPAPMEGEFYPTEDAIRLLQILVDRRARAEVAEARLELANADLAAAEARIVVLEHQLAKAQAQVDLEKAKRPSWFESHVGLCGGLYGGYSLNENTADVGVGVLYGIKF